MGQNNNFKNANFHATTQIVEGNVYNVNSERDDNQATYHPTPVWRSQITLATLTWLSFFISISSLFPIYKIIIEPILSLRAGNYGNIGKSNYLFIILIIDISNITPYS